MEHEENNKDLGKELMFQTTLCTFIAWMRYNIKSVWYLGKPVALKQVQNSVHFQHLADLFTNQGATKKDIIAAGEEALVHVYNGKQGEGIDGLRYKRFCEKVAKSSTFVEPQTMPPTSAATQHHSLRAYLQFRHGRDCWTIESR